ncbi:uncharacterized protein BKA78DRAFT_82956 [Phyllosticta capitalensis]|uniref:uncharacterized protein n=1 Tax=Phyllosticta capitalensis TaxID=121624 RepID=UPI00312DCE22
MRCGPRPLSCFFLDGLFGLAPPPLWLPSPPRRTPLKPFFHGGVFDKTCFFYFVNSIFSTPSMTTEPAAPRLRFAARLVTSPPDHQSHYQEPLSVGPVSALWSGWWVSSRHKRPSPLLAPRPYRRYFFFFFTTSVRDGLPRKPPGFNISGDLALQASPEADGRDQPMTGTTKVARRTDCRRGVCVNCTPSRSPVG